MSSFNVADLKANKTPSAKSRPDELPTDNANGDEVELTNDFLLYDRPEAPKLETTKRSFAPEVVALAKELATRDYGPTPTEQRLLDNHGWPSDWRHEGWRLLLDRLERVKATLAEMADIKAQGELDGQQAAKLEGLRQQMVRLAPAEVTRRVAANLRSQRVEPLGKLKSLGPEIVRRRRFVEQMSDFREAELYFGTDVGRHAFFEQYPNALSEDAYSRPSINRLGFQAALDDIKQNVIPAYEAKFRAALPLCQPAIDECWAPMEAWIESGRI